LLDRTSIQLLPNPVSRVESAPPAQVDISSIVGAILRRWKLIAAIPLVAVTMTYGILKLVPPLYNSTAEILVFDPGQQLDNSLQKQVSPFMIAVDDVAMNTEIEIIKSKSMALRVVKELNLDNDPEFQLNSWLSLLAGRLGPASPPQRDDIPQTHGDPQDATAERLENAAEVLLERLQVNRVPFSYVVTVSVASQDPVKAQRLAATVTNDFLASQREARETALQRVADWLKGRVNDLQSRILETQAAAEKLRSENGLADTEPSNVTAQQITELNAQLVEVRGEVATQRAHLEQARHVIEDNGDIQEIPELMASGVISQLRQQQEQLSWREGELRRKLGDSHAEVLVAGAQLAGLNKQINNEAQRILGGVKNSYDIIVQRERSLEASLHSLTAADSESPASVKLQQLRRLADSDRKLSEGYLSQLNELSQRRTLEDASARVIAPATLAAAPSSPRRKLFYAAAGVLGLGGGLMLVFLGEFLNVGVKTGAQVEQSFGYPVVGVIPFMPQRKSRRVEYNRLLQRMVDAPLSQFSEAVRSMRIGLELSRSEQAPKVILITSSLPGEGKSTAAMLLAASSSISGRKTVLVDCDLRQRSISEAFGRKHPGLSELLRGTAELKEVIDIDPATDTSVIPAGAIVPNPADLLMSQRMRDLIERLRTQYDYVVVDAAPLLPVVDALALATMVDKILVIVEWSRTPRVSISEAFKVLRPEADRIAGIVLNKVDLKQLQGYHYGRGYNYPSGSANA